MRRMNMSKITEVYYTEINEMTAKEAAAFYYHYNLINVSEVFHEDYIKYEENQIALRNKILGDAYKNNEIPRHPKTNTSIFGISSLKNKPVLITEY
jgi:hypothetical protein